MPTAPFDELLGITLRHAFLGTSVLLLVVGWGSASDEETSSVRHSIVGGQRSLEFPAVGALVVANEYLCTGTLVAPNIVLTAAHC